MRVFFSWSYVLFDGCQDIYIVDRYERVEPYNTLDIRPKSTLTVPADLYIPLDSQ